MIWPLRYSTMVEHGRCANGSSSGFGVAKVLDAIKLSPPRPVLFFSFRRGLWRAGLSDGFDAANFEDRAGALRVVCPPDGHLLTYMLGKPFFWEPLCLQGGDDLQVTIVHQDILSFLLIHAAR